jgi:LAO/AO transport system kinase
LIDVEALAKGVGSGERSALSKAITLAESTLSRDRALLGRLFAALPAIRASLRLGVSGSPGVGKSTFIDKLGSHIVAAGGRPAVLAFDPAGRHGGSILGDKTRMHELSRHEAAFVRPSSNRRYTGGVGPATFESILLCEAAGFDPVIVETVGVGQSEVSVAELVDFVVVLLLPNAGDELQGIKKGLLEYADFVVVTKADGVGLAQAKRAASAYQSALSLLKGETPVSLVSALEARGVSEVWQQVSERYAAECASGLVQRQRTSKLAAIFRRQLLEALGRRLLSRQDIQERLREVERCLARGDIRLSQAIDEILKMAPGLDQG